MTDTVVFRSKRGVVGAVRYFDGKLQVKGSVADMAKMWLDRGQKAKDFVPHYLGWSNGYLIGEPPGDVAKHLPGQHDQRTHGHRHGVPDFDFGAKPKLLAMLESNNVVHVQFAEQVLDLCKTYPNVGRDLQTVDVWSHLEAATEGVGPGVMASAGAREDGWGMNLFDEHCEMYLRSKQIDAMIGQIVAEYEGDREQRGPITHVSAVVPVEELIRSVAVHEFGHLVHNHVFIYTWEKANQQQPGYGEEWTNTLTPDQLGHQLKGHVPKHARNDYDWGDDPDMEALDPAFAPMHVSEYAAASNAEAGAEWFAAAHYGMFGASLDSWREALEHRLDWNDAMNWGVTIKKALNILSDHACSFDRRWVGLEVAVREALARDNGDVAKRGRLDWSPKSNWVEEAGGLDPYIEDIAVALMRDHGMTRGRAIATAWSRCRMWAAGGGGVKPETKAKAAKAVANMERKRAKAKAD